MAVLKVHHLTGHDPGAREERRGLSEKLCQSELPVLHTDQAPFPLHIRAVGAPEIGHVTARSVGGPPVGQSTGLGRRCKVGPDQLFHLPISHTAGLEMGHARETLQKEHAQPAYARAGWVVSSGL